MNHFDVSRLTVDDIAAMSRDGESLYEFKQAVARLATRLPEMTSPETRRRRLQEAAAQAVDEWNARKMSMSRFARDFFSLGLLEKGNKLFEEGLKAVLPPALGGAAAVAGGVMAAGTSAVLATVPGLVVGVAIYAAGIAAKQRAAQAASPYRYLSRLVKHGAALAVAPPPSPRS